MEYKISPKQLEILIQSSSYISAYQNDWYSVLQYIHILI